MNIRQKSTVALVDIMVIVELCMSIYLANRDPENMTLLFLRSFFLMLIPTLIMAGLSLRMLRSRGPEAGS